MHLQLGPNSLPLNDGFASWDDSATDALAVWNSHIGASKFAALPDSTVTRAGRNGLNNVYFSNTVNGQAWGAGVLAVTVTYSSGASNTETDVLFNGLLTWNSYRGAMRFSSGTPIYDFHRIALHEFGHALGLDHPDSNGQTVSALMNSRITSLDALTSDDISGAQSLYGASAVVAPPTISTSPTSRSVEVGQPATFNVVATSTVAISYQWLKAGAALDGATGSSFSIASVAPTDAGNYSVVVSNSAGSVTSPAATLTVQGVPVIISPPANQSVAAGNALQLSVVAAGTPPFTYQWLKDGREVPGATSPNLILETTGVTDAGHYSVRISNRLASIVSASVEITVRASRLINLSTRAFVPAGGTLTPGFFIRGSGSKPLLIRAIGPTLQRFGVTAALTETRLELLVPGSATPLALGGTYQALSDADVAIRVGAFPLEPNARDATVQATLEPQAYTVRISGGNAGMMGVALAEIYDADSPASSAQLVNVSTLGYVGPGENVLTAGFVVSGNATKRLLIRAVGPSLTTFGVAGALPDPQLALMPQAGAEPIAFNDDWSDTAVVRSAFTNSGAFLLPAGSKDAALVVTIEPGAYTVVVSSVIASVTGQALVEIYDLDP
jgi:hypothetical protein